MRKYEIMYILHQDTTDTKAVQKKLHDVLIANGGNIIASEDWGLKDFAYEINHKKKGFYTVVIVETTSENINEFQRVAGIDKYVVRTMVINTESEKRYIQSTKLSKTDMSVFKEERKPQRGGFDKRRSFEKRDDYKPSAPRSFEGKTPSRDAETPTKQVEPTTPVKDVVAKTVEKVIATKAETKPTTPAPKAVKDAEAKPAAPKKPAAEKPAAEKKAAVKKPAAPKKSTTEE